MSAVPARARPPLSHARASPPSRLEAAPTPQAMAPATVHVTRYPAVKAEGATGVRVFVIRVYNATVGATDGNTTAAIITPQRRTNQPRPPRAVHGPESIPRICSADHHQATAAMSRSA